MKPSTVKLGVVASAGGSAIFELLPLLRMRGIELVVATDRACAIEEKCVAHDVMCQRFDYANRDVFSEKVADYFVSADAKKLVLLFYSRFVGPRLYEYLPTLNIHPAALPLFPGLHALERQIKEKAPNIGATLHAVDETCDGGPILGQIVTAYTAKNAQRISFLQKSFLALGAVDHYLLNLETPVHYTNATLSLSLESDRFFRSIESRHQQAVLT